MKVISFSLWGTDNKYIYGALKNAELREKIYPNWKMRFYTDKRIIEKYSKQIEEMVNYGSEIYPKPPCDDYMGLFWRMEIGYDNSVDRFIIRDTDSRINPREARAVKEWEETKFPVHIMRDHHKYHNVYILGGMWGAVKGFMPDYKEKLEYWVKNECVPKPDKNFWGSDQLFLKRYVWSKFENNHMAHDDKKRVTKKEFKFHVNLPKKQFVGQQWTEENKPIYPGEN